MPNRRIDAPAVANTVIRHGGLVGAETWAPVASSPAAAGLVSPGALEMVVRLRVFVLREVEHRRVLHQPHADAVREQIAEQALEQRRETGEPPSPRLKSQSETITLSTSRGSLHSRTCAILTRRLHLFEDIDS